jgi:hypothetical protein
MAPEQVVILARTVDEPFVSQWLSALRALGADVEWVTEADFTPGQYTSYDGDPLVLVVWSGLGVPGWLGWFAATALDYELRLVSAPVRAGQWAADDPPFLKKRSTIDAFDEHGRLEQARVAAWFADAHAIRRPRRRPGSGRTAIVPNPSRSIPGSSRSSR